MKNAVALVLALNCYHCCLHCFWHPGLDIWWLTYLCVCIKLSHVWLCTHWPFRQVLSSRSGIVGYSFSGISQRLNSSPDNAGRFFNICATGPLRVNRCRGWRSDSVALGCVNTVYWIFPSVTPESPQHQRKPNVALLSPLYFLTLKRRAIAGSPSSQHLRLCHSDINWKRKIEGAYDPANFDVCILIVLYEHATSVQLSPNINFA